MNVLLVNKVYKIKSGKIRCKGGYSDERERCVNLNKITYLCVDQSNLKYKKFKATVLKLQNENNNSKT